MRKYFDVRVSSSEYIPRWNQFRNFTSPLEIPSIEAIAPTLCRFFRTVAFRENEDSAAAVFIRALETDVYALITLHHSAQTAYGKIYIMALYQFARGVQASLKKDEDMDRAGWLDLADRSLETLSEMNRD